MTFYADEQNILADLTGDLTIVECEFRISWRSFQNVSDWARRFECVTVLLDTVVHFDICKRK
jgi:hypothetical protein